MNGHLHLVPCGHALVVHTAHMQRVVAFAQVRNYYSGRRVDGLPRGVFVHVPHNSVILRSVVVQYSGEYLYGAQTSWYLNVTTSVYHLIDRAAVVGLVR